MPAATVSLVGNLTRAPELRCLPNGQMTASFGIAVNRRFRTPSNLNSTVDVASFFTVVVWRQLAENVYETLRKGDRVVVTGRLDQRGWEDKDGRRHSAIEIVADEVAVSLRFATAQITRVERRRPLDASEPSDGPLDDVAADDEAVGDAAGPDPAHRGELVGAGVGPGGGEEVF